MAKINAVHSAFINHCDAKDGLKDGIVNDPEHCSFDPAIIQCKEGDGNDCLTAPQVVKYKGSGSTDDATNFECKAK